MMRWCANVACCLDENSKLMERIARPKLNILQLLQDLRHLQQRGELVDPCRGLDVSKDVDSR
jgi:hypothetical protein